MDFKAELLAVTISRYREKTNERRHFPTNLQWYRQVLIITLPNASRYTSK